MRFCEKHWNDLKSAIEVRGLSHLIAKDGETAMNSMVAQIENTADKTDFDPMMGAYWRISGEILKIRGFTFMGEDAPFGGCGLCEPDETNPGWADNWINGASDEMLSTARHLNLVSAPN